jgi:hypothetical protein
MFFEYIYIYIYIWTVQSQNDTPEHSEIKTFHSNWKNKTPIETKLPTLAEGASTFSVQEAGAVGGSTISSIARWQRE